jgi:hypothetical protein
MMRAAKAGFQWTAKEWSSKHIPFDWTGPGPA